MNRVNSTQVGNFQSNHKIDVQKKVNLAKTA